MHGEDIVQRYYYCCRVVKIEKIPWTGRSVSVRIRDSRLTKLLIKELQGNLTKIGERFGVSSKTVTKWCIKFGIPSHKKELVQYIIDNL